MEFKNGKVTKKIQEIGDSPKDNNDKFITGTKITFLPSYNIFSNLTAGS